MLSSCNCPAVEGMQDRRDDYMNKAGLGTILELGGQIELHTGCSQIGAVKPGVVK